ncbi:helix-turn-helix transcriptional regulator [Paenibacillus cisolokensis]|uniref:helix-turn-helix domain-containing protein n=1 Tax=Paenibacillus cisolokensis TaxID=1658519 RepID=UPI003D29B5B5
MSLGEKVRTIRKSHELNQKEFALRIGVSQGTLSDIERGVCLPSCETIIALRNRFHCDLNWLLADDEYVSSTEVRISSEESELLSIFRSLPHHEKNELLEIVQIKKRKKKYPNTD